MCGITGWISWNKDMTTERPTITNMAATLSKRGPDAVNTFCSHYAALGHTRLIVVDPKGGSQPMTRTKNGKAYTLVYNGELYNTEDIRQELLSKGYSFQGHSDTEVLLTSFMEWGPKCVQILNGIYAFAVWDANRQELFLGRDRLGVKPLFYSEKNGSFIFGSELKALLKHPEISCNIGYGGLREVLGLGPSRTPGHGLFEGINELRAGHAARFGREGLKIYRYWQLKSAEHQDSLEETAAKVRHLVKDAITRQLVSDVPICTLLSGGLDSSAITAIAAHGLKETGKGPLHTYSIDYQDNELYFQKSDFQPDSDQRYIELMSERFGTVHHNLVISTDQLVEHLKEAVLVRDQPGMADVDSSLLWFCREIKKQATVALSGECADEIFGGYPWFHRPDLTTKDSFPWMQSAVEREKLLRPPWRAALQIPDYVHERYEETLQEVPRLHGEDEAEARRRELFYLNIIWFMTALLDRKDRMSMGASLEVRVPFADHRLVEYVWNIPWEMKNHEQREKGILRKALEGILPNEIVYRKKSPYPKTHNPHYTRAVKTWLLKIIEDPHSPLLEILEKDKIAEIIRTNGKSFTKPWFGQLMSGPQLMAYLAQVNTWLVEYNINIVTN